MILFPAIDIKDGQCVRLRQGLENEVTVFSSDPAAMAEHWERLGAGWLHLVDLDGAFSGKPVNRELVRDICSRVGIPVQLGGGIRDLDTAKAYLDAGVKRLIIGTMALENKELFARLCTEYPGKIGVSLDARDGRLKSRGWVEDTGLMIQDVVPELEEMGSAFFVYTDISRDGMQSGINMDALEKMLGLTDKPVLIAGGVSVLEDIMQIYHLVDKGLEGAITGRAIYSGSLDFQVAVDWIRQKQQT
ncbi:1-(5-phosphoribosyl)-5-[(5-phosphoribosylamino)methylideneamino]imidazole-4-carboxamide isomerase [Desulfonatronovibrio hydrogenovorans]|uniref:1-(5-phosphoribosyl)-5-[(5- phosphoribosylamino)methylideneamino]imidazole-4- carboxamide isomerase n=1 Tax=Desulfonatronovibrio hydrogenovorans TaxID=53245 RepID=UPI0004911FCE|nr:1-(5-phosphoribosyl)-5-[(5-phosphoribosylamino)methylideneamino]imidazole-4-carboxamide isomerase [Desulfonatronovibrio hydrogenovorans]